MHFKDLLATFGNEPLIHSAWLLTAGRSVAAARQDLTRWTRQGRLIQLRRGVYVLNQPWRKCPLNLFHLANRIVLPSYVSMQAALAWHGLIPEAVPVVTSVTTGRPQRHDTPVGSFVFRHVKKTWFTGFVETQIDGQPCFMAHPEKALLDLIALTPGGDTPAFLHELRLQHLERLDQTRLAALARSAGSPKLQRAAQAIAEIAHQENEAFDEL